MYMFGRKNWEENKERFIESYRIAEPVSRLTRYSEMTDHRFLLEDRTVQQTEFSNGVQVTVNIEILDKAFSKVGRSRRDRRPELRH